MLKPFLGIPPTIKLFMRVGLKDIVWTVDLAMMKERNWLREMVRF